MLEKGLLYNLYKHTYRARNKYNALELHTDYVYYNPKDNKVATFFSEEVFEGYKKFLEKNADGWTDLKSSLMLHGIYLPDELTAIQKKDKAKMYTLAYKYLVNDNQYYKKVIGFGKSQSLPYLSYARIMFTLYRFSPTLTATALIDANS